LFIDSDTDECLKSHLAVHYREVCSE